MPYNRAYKGNLEVEDEAFELRAERLIVRAHDVKRTDIFEVAFQLGGPHDGDTYSLDGVSTRVPDGRYVSGRLPVTWGRHAGTDVAEIVLMQVEETSERCKVVGEWCEYGDCYQFSGLLEPFLAQA